MGSPDNDLMSTKMGNTSIRGRTLIVSGMAKLRNMILFVPVLTLFLGTLGTLILYSSWSRKEGEENRRATLQRAQNTINKVDLLVSNSMLRVQSYEDYLGSRWINYERESEFLKKALEYTVFERLSVYQRSPRWKKGVTEDLKYRRLLRVEMENTKLSQVTGNYLLSPVIRNAINEMEKSGIYQRALFYSRMDLSRLTVVLKARSRLNIYFAYTLPLEKLFDKAELLRGENLKLTDLGTNLSWNISRNDQGAIVATPEPAALAGAEEKPTYTFVFGEGLPQSGLRVGMNFQFNEEGHRVSAASITSLLTFAVTLLFAYLFWILISQNRRVSRLVIEKTNDLEKARHQASEALLDKTRLIGNISHEIRTPLNLMLGMIDLCEEKDPDRRFQDYLSNMRTSGNHLLAMIEDLLDLARSESNEIHVQMKPFNLSQFLDEIARFGGQECAKKNLRMYVNLDENLPMMVVSDSSRLRQILMNLLKNATKYTNQGFVSLKVTSQDTGTAGSRRLRFEIRDSGVGIPKDKIGRIFDAFFQLDSSHVLSEGGVGLGLSIVRELVRKLQGKIEVRSTPGHGSTFHVDLNLQTPDETPWFHRFKSFDRKSRDLVLMSGDPIWTESVMALRNHPNLNIMLIAPNEFEHYLKSTPENSEQTVLCDLRSCGISLDEFRQKMGSRKYIVAGNKKEILDGIGEPIFPVIDSTPTLLSDVLAAVGLSSRKRLRPQKESIPVAPAKDEKAILDQDISIVVADDDVGNRELYKAYFENAKWDIDYAENGQFAWESYLKHNPDMLILDVRMPVLDGFGVIEKVRQHERANGLPQTPVILVTADALEQTAERARGIDNVVLLTKPIRKAKLLEMMNQAHKDIEIA